MRRKSEKSVSAMSLPIRPPLQAKKDRSKVEVAPLRDLQVSSSSRSLAPLESNNRRQTWIGDMC